jgi:hypothetical protein
MRRTDTHTLDRDRSTPRLLASLCLVLLGLISWPVVLNAYDIPLTAAALHDAWVLGQRNDQATAEFLAPYSKEIQDARPGSTPHIAEMEVLTPFAQVVDESRQKLGGFTEQQAAQAYHRRGDTIVVRVRLMLPAAYPEAERGAQAPPASKGQNAALRPENFWQKFQFAVKQHGKAIDSRSVRNQPVYSAATKDSPSTLDGQTVWLEFEPNKIASDQLTVEVTTPDGKTSSTLFDLQKLR